MAGTDPGINTEPRAKAAEILKRYRRPLTAGVILVGVFAVTFLAYNLIGLYRAGQAPTPEKPSGKPPGPEYGFLPETTRDLDQPADRTGVRDPFLAPPRLVGVILGGRGENLAIIETGTTAQVVAPGEEVAGMWTVAEIGSGSVRLVSEDEDKEILLELAGHRPAGAREE